MTDFSKLSLEELQQRLDVLASEWNAVETAIQDKMVEDKKKLVEEIHGKIAALGYELDDIVHLMLPRKRRGRVAASDRSYTTFVDPENAGNTYIRGPLPAWLKNKMKAAGFDPSTRDQREAFKKEHLRALGS